MDGRRHSSRDDEQLESDVFVHRLYAFTTRASRISPPPRVSVSPCLPVSLSWCPRLPASIFDIPSIFGQRSRVAWGISWQVS
jgi:hypothetical protein